MTAVPSILLGTLLALGLTAEVSAAARPAKLTAAQLTAMSACVDQEHAGQPAPPVCRPFFRTAGGAPLVLTDGQEARLAECVDQQQGQGTPGAPNACADFVRKLRGSR